jgi:Major Facilitator Superfamily
MVRTRSLSTDAAAALLGNEATRRAIYLAFESVAAESVRVFSARGCRTRVGDEAPATCAVPEPADGRASGISFPTESRRVWRLPDNLRSWPRSMWLGLQEPLLLWLRPDTAAARDWRRAERVTELSSTATLLTEDLSWRWCLYVNLLFAAIAVVGALAYTRGGRPVSRPRMDWPGAVLACAAPFAIVFGFSQAETAGWAAALTLGSLVCGVVLLAGFVVAEQRVPHPLLPLRVILDRARGGSYVAVGISGMAIFGTFLFLTFYLQVVKGYSPLTTGLLFLPMTVCIMISSNLSSNIGLGPRALIAGGMLLSAVGMALLTRVSVTSSYVSGVLPALLILGLGLGLIFAQAINTATAGVAREDSGVASALCPPAAARSAISGPPPAM